MISHLGDDLHACTHDDAYFWGGIQKMASFTHRMMICMLHDLEMILHSEVLDNTASLLDIIDGGMLSHPTHINNKMQLTNN